MTTGNTTLLGLALPVQGELGGTWGNVVNTSITALLDTAIAGTTTLSANADATLTTTTLAANEARQAVILWTASNGATTRNITAPAQSKPYIVINAGTGSIVLRGAGPTTGVTIVSGEKCLAAWNGSDFVKISTSVAVNTISFGTTGLTPNTATSGTVTVAGTLAIANGGTGQTTASAAFNALSPITTTGDLILGTGVNTASRLAIGANGYLLTSNGTTASWVAAPASGVTTFSAGTTGLTPNSATNGAITLAGTLAIANGGTGQTTASTALSALGGVTAGKSIAFDLIFAI